MQDMLTWFRNPNFKTSHLEGLNTNPITGKTSKVIQYCADTGTNLVFTKTSNGFPWDVKAYDSLWIYDTITEANWTSSKDYKLNGWPMCPRYWDGDPSWYYYQASAIWKQFTNCTQVASGEVGPVTYDFQGPFQMDFGGDVGTVQTILENYYWTATKNREQLFLTQAFGWVKWTHATLQPNGFYLLDSISNHNKVVSGVIKPKFDCYQL